MELFGNTERQVKKIFIILISLICSITYAQENSELKNLAYRGKNGLSLEFFMEDLILPEDEIINFMYYCARMPEFKTLVEKNSKLELMKFFSSKAEEFLEFRELD